MSDDEDEPGAEYNAKYDDLMDKILDLLDREDPNPKMAMYVLMNIAIGMPLQHMGIEETALKSLLSDMVDKYLLRLRAQ
jgi:hypothetical protein